MEPNAGYRMLDIWSSKLQLAFSLSSIKHLASRIQNRRIRKKITFFGKL